MKRFLLMLARVLAVLVSWIPATLRRGFLSGLMVVESRIGDPGSSLKRLFALSDGLDTLIGERATVYGGGVNPKHRLIGYHDFFIERIPPDSRVLDVGCGIGAVARSIADQVPGVQVTAIDADDSVLDRARAAETPSNLTYIHPKTSSRGSRWPSRGFRSSWTARRSAR